METSRLSYTSVTEYMNMSMRDFMDFRTALNNVLEREKTAREEARKG